MRLLKLRWQKVARPNNCKSLDYVKEEHVEARQEIDPKYENEDHYADWEDDGYSYSGSDWQALDHRLREHHPFKVASAPVRKGQTTNVKEKRPAYVIVSKYLPIWESYPIVTIG